MICRLCEFPAQAGQQTCAKCAPIFSAFRVGKRLRRKSLDRKRSLKVAEFSAPLWRNEVSQMKVIQQAAADLPGCNWRVYLRELAYIAREAASTRDPRIAQLDLQLLARQAPKLVALAAEVRK